MRTASPATLALLVSTFVAGCAFGEFPAGAAWNDAGGGIEPALDSGEQPIVWADGSTNSEDAGEDSSQSTPVVPDAAPPIVDAWVKDSAASVDSSAPPPPVDAAVDASKHVVDAAPDTNTSPTCIQPDTAGPCNACSPTDTCQLNGCYNGYVCDTSGGANKCVKPTSC